jgi:hypothetical protein
MNRLALAVAAVLLASGCSSGTESPGPPAGEADTGPGPMRSDAVPSDAVPSTPATTSGPLSLEVFPSPQLLGRGWTYRVDPGDAEGGYVGNGTPGLERNPDELATLAVPLGCERPRLPRADHAFEVDYAFRHTPVVAVRLAFADPETAERFYADRLRALRGCLGTNGGAAVGPLVSTVRTLSGTTVLSDRTPRSDPWVEAGLVQGRHVLLMAARGRVGAAPLGPRQMQVLERQLGGGA